MPLFSIIIPVLNAGETLAKALSSVAAQTCRDYEVILRDGGSLDNTLTVAETFRATFGARLLVFSRSDAGIYDAMNLALRAAQGRWIYFLGADDSLAGAGVLKTVAASIRRSDFCQIIHGDVVLQSTGQRYAGSFDRAKLLKKNICHQAIFYHRAVFQRIGNYHVEFPIWADWDFNLRCFHDPKVEIRYLDLVVALYNDVSGFSKRGRDQAFLPRLQRLRLENHVPALSVIVRTMGRNERLAECLDSLDNQSSRDFEVVIVDMSGGSAAKILGQPRQLRLRHLDTRGRILNRPVALNYGMRHAAGKYLAVLDDDHLWRPPQVKTLLNLLRTSQADLVYTGVRRLTSDSDGGKVQEKRRFHPFDYERLIVGNYIHAAATAFGKEAWEKAGRYDARFPVYEDWELLMRLARNGKVASEETFWAISRSFPSDLKGCPHNLAREERERCQAAIFWKHRALYRPFQKANKANEANEANAGLREQSAFRWPLIFRWWLKNGFATVKYFSWNQ